MATAIDGQPMISPVNDVFDERAQSVTFRSSDGTKLHELLHVGHAVFEIDEIDPACRTGWSVIISGVPEEVTPPPKSGGWRGWG